MQNMQMLVFPVPYFQIHWRTLIIATLIKFCWLTPWVQVSSHVEKSWPSAYILAKKWDGLNPRDFLGSWSTPISLFLFLLNKVMAQAVAKMM